MDLQELWSQWLGARTGSSAAAQGGEGTAVPEDSPVQQDVLFCGKDGVVSIEQVLAICGLQGQVVAVVLNSRRTPLFHINVCGASREGDNVIVAITVTGTERCP